MINKNKTVELRILKAILGVYIILAIIIAGLNYGYVNQANPKVAAFITWLWSFYENWIKTLFILIGSFLTLRIIGTSQRSTMRKRNLRCLLVVCSMVQSTDYGFCDWIGWWKPGMAENHWSRSTLWFNRFFCFL